MKNSHKEEFVALLIGATSIVIGASFLLFSWGIIPGLIFLGLGFLIALLASPVF
jgi:CHASE2 domain-containing sensor protein